MTRITLRVSAALLAACVTTAVADEFEMIRWTIDGGGVSHAAGGDFELSGTAGQSDAGAMMIGQGFELTGGFWFSAIAGDCNEDAAVNVFDYDVFGGCVTGPDGDVALRCRCSDFDQDGDVDLTDFARLQVAFTE